MRFDRSEAFSIAVGFLVLAAVVGVIYLATTKLYVFLTPADALPAGALTMGVYFEDEANSSGLRVYGDVLEAGTSVGSGHAHVTVRRLNDALVQSVSVLVIDGRFDSGAQPAFKLLRASDRLNISVEVRRADTTLVAEGETYMNVYPPFRPSSVRWTAAALVVTSVVFFWAFTGVATPRKNQAAIIFSYVVMLLFLALPFMAFYVLGRYQAVAQVAQDVAGSTPVGVLPAVPLNDSDGNVASDAEREWVLNIGGLVRTRHDTITRQRESNGDRGKGDQNADSPPSQDRETLAPLRGGEPGRPVGVEPPQAPTGRPDSGDSSGVPDYIIEGGIVIPLYVLVLSIIGGAINMTRMLPVYQREAQTLINPKDWLRTVGGTVLAKRLGAAPSAGATSGPAGGDRATESQSFRTSTDSGTAVSILATTPEGGGTSSLPAVTVAVTQAPADAEPAEPNLPSPAQESSPSTNEQVTPGRTTTVTATPAATTLTPVEVAAIWRQGLITQHMYLLAAPFLAIAVFYLLDWLDMQKKPLLVLASLSVGLTSDKILSAILSVVVPILDRGRDNTGMQLDVKTPE